MALADLLPISYVEIGKIKIGGKAQTARETKGGGSWRPPEKWDHFVITTLFRDNTENLIPDVSLMESLKDYADKKDGKLRSIPIMFGSNDIEEVMQTSYTWYIGKTCGARTDGKTLTFFADPKTGKRLDNPTVGQWSIDWLGVQDPCSRSPKKMFKRSTNLNCMIASPAARFGGYYRFRTTSEISSRQLYGSLVNFVGTTDQRGLSHGVLRGLPFRLVVRPMAVAPEGKATTVYVVHVEYMHGDLKALQAAAAEQRMLELNAVEQTLQTQSKYRELLAHVTANDEPDPDMIDDNELPMLPLPGVSRPQAEIDAEKRAEAQGRAIDGCEKGVAGAGTLEELQAFWKSDAMKTLWNALDANQREGIIGLKNARKAELEKPKVETPPVTEPAPEPVVEPAPDGPPDDDNGPPDDEAEDHNDKPAEPLKAGRGILDAIEKLLAEKKIVFAEWRKGYAEITSDNLTDLTAPQALQVVEVLKKVKAS